MLILEVFFSWKMVQIVDVEHNFTWAVGDQPLSWYQVNSQPQSPSQDKSGCSNCPNPQTAGPQCGMTYVAATTVSEVCNQLNQMGFSGSIASIKKTSPALNDTTRPSPSTTCTDVTFKNIPSCQQFALQAKPVVPMVVNVTGGQAVAFYYTGFGGIVLGGSDALPPIHFLTDEYLLMLTDQNLNRLTDQGGVYAFRHMEASREELIEKVNWRLPPFFQYTGTGGFSMAGSQPYIGKGGMSFGGVAGTNVTIVYTGTGGMIFGGNGSFVSPSWNYTGTGGMVLGGSGTAVSNYYSLTDNWVMSASITFVEAEFTIQQGTTLVAPLETISTNCGCSSLPLSLLFQSNFASTNVFSGFLLRNSLTLPTSQPLFYNRPLGAWQQNLHITGVGDTGQTERWDIVFEWACSNQLADQDIGQNYWQFLANFVKRNTLTGQRQFTKVLVIMDSSGLCADPNLFGVSFTINTLTGVTTLQSSASLELQVITDEIGLFNGVWNISPILSIAIALVPQRLPFNLVDGTPLLLQTPSIFV